MHSKHQICGACSAGAPQASPHASRGERARRRRRPTHLEGTPSSSDEARRCVKTRSTLHRGLRTTEYACLRVVSWAELFSDAALQLPGAVDLGPSRSQRRARRQAASEPAGDGPRRGKKSVFAGTRVRSDEKITVVVFAWICFDELTNCCTCGASLRCPGRSAHSGDLSAHRGARQGFHRRSGEYRAHSGLTAGRQTSPRPSHRRVSLLATMPVRSTCFRRCARRPGARSGPGCVQGTAHTAA